MRIKIWNGLLFIGMIGHIGCSKTKHLLNSGDETQINNENSNRKIESNTNEKISNLTDTINFVYDSPINGFNISVTLMNLSDYIDDKIGTAKIYFEKDGMIHTIIILLLF